MEGFFGIIGQMVVLFSIVAVGYAAKKMRYMTRTFDKMFSRLILDVAIPGMIIGAVLATDELPSPQDILLAFGVSCASYLVVIAIAFIVTFALRIHKGHRGVFRFMLCFGNVGFIGFPVLSVIFGPEALIYAAIFNLPFNILVFTVGVWFLSQDKAEGHGPKVTWRMFLSPAIISCVVATVLALLGVHNVPVVGPALNTLGSLTTPGALLVIGSSLASLPVSKLLGGPRLWAASAFRLLLIPLAVWAVFHLFVTDPLMLGAIVVISGMPVATNGTMLCYRYGGDSRTMAQGTFVTTVLSLLTIPLLVEFLSIAV